MRHAVTGAIACVALLGAVSMAIAQDRDGRDRRSGAGQAPSAPAARAQRSERPAIRSQGAQPRTIERQSSSRRERAAPQRQIRQRQAEPRARPERQLRQKQAEPRAETPKRAQKREDRSRQRAEQQQRQEQQRAAQKREEPRKDPSKEPSKTTQGPPPSAGKGKEATKQDVKRVQATEEQRVRVRDRLSKENREHRADRIRNFRPVIGAHIPRRHRLHRLPVWIVEFAPIYSNYSYVWVEDTICIVDPATYVVVDVLPASSQRAESRELNLTSEQMRFIRAEVPKDASVDVRIRLALGAEIPRNVALYTFPDHVLARIPKLASYRYVVVGGDVAIVDPADYAVVLVISD